MGKQLSRKEKEDLYILEMTKLQRHWGNPIDGDWDFVTKWTDEQLDEGIKSTIGQIGFEKTWSAIGTFFKIIILSFVVLGVIGLLIFGIKQIF